MSSNNAFSVSFTFRNVPVLRRPGLKPYCQIRQSMASNPPRVLSKDTYVAKSQPGWGRHV